MSGGSLRMRLLAAAGVSIALALALAGVGLVQLFEGHVRDRVNQELANHMRQLLAAIEVSDTGALSERGNLADPRFVQPLSGLYWKVEASTGEVFRSRSLWDADIALPGPMPMLGNVREVWLAGPDGTSLIGLERVVSVKRTSGEMRLRLVVAVLADEVSAPVGDFARTLAASLGLLAVFLIAAAWVQVGVGLKPLEQLRRRLGDVRSGRESRLQGHFPSEIEPLVEEVNNLLAEQAKTLVKARSRAGDLAHGLKTPLTVLTALAREFNSAGRSSEASEIATQIELMREHVERELARARISSEHAAQLTDAYREAESIIAAMRRLPRGSDISWRLEMAESRRLRIDPSDLIELLGNLLDNARKWAGSLVRISDRRCPNGVEIVIEDDGPGVPAEELKGIRQRGRKLDESKQGFGLGLAIVEDIAAAYGLKLGFGPSELGGLRVAVGFPVPSSSPS